MNIIFLSLGKMERIDDRGIYNDLLKKFRDEGHNVYAVTPRESRFKQVTELEVDEGINLLRVKVGNITKTNYVEKGISTLLIENQYIKAIKKYFSDVKFDLVLYATPPITFTNVVNYIKKRDGALSYLLLKDIFPQNAVDLNVFQKSGVLYKFFKRKEKSLFRASDFIGTMSEANSQFIIRDNPELDTSKVEVCPNTITPKNMQLSKNQKEKIREKYSIPKEKKVLIYGGNLGKPQGIEYLIKCMEDASKLDDIFFLIVGDGTEYSKLEDYKNRTKNNNYLLIKQLPRDEYELLTMACDVGPIFLDKRFTIPNFPSRLLSYMEAGMPVLAATDMATDIGSTIENGQFGYYCISDKPADFTQIIKKLIYNSDMDAMGENARQYLEKKYTSTHAYETIIKHMK